MELGVALYEGLLPLAEQYDLAIAGGDTNSWDGPLVISITVLGLPGPAGPLLRSGARPGDRIVATGTFGGSILGHHLDFEPRVNEAIRLAERYELHAGIDTSATVCRSTCRAWLPKAASGPCFAPRRSRSPMPRGDWPWSAPTASDRSNTRWAMGEDFELLLAVPPGETRRMLAEQTAAVPLTDIGEFVAEPGLWLSGDQTGRRPLSPRGLGTLATHEHAKTLVPG